MLNFVKNFLADRFIQIRVGCTYSAARKLDMGLPQGSVLSPLLFNIFMADLPSIISKETVLVQFADDICIWKKVTMKRSTPKRSLNHIQKCYQQELNKIDTYLSYNGLSLALDKTKAMLFNAGPDPKHLPQLKIQEKKIMYTNCIKFLGVTLSSKLNWKLHFEDVLNKGRKGINLLKVVASQKWAQDTAGLRNLAFGLIRSKLTYAQEIFFNAPEALLKKLQSIDCKAFKVALGVPYHACNLGTYKEMDVLPLNFLRKAASTKFIVKSIAMSAFCTPEVDLLNSSNFPKRGSHIKSLQTIRSFVSDTLDKVITEGEQIDIATAIPTIPSWTHFKANFDIDDCDMNKSLQPHVMKTLVQEKLLNIYNDHIKIFTDGSRLDNGNAGAAFVIPSLKIQKNYHLGNKYSIFSAELVGILKALQFIGQSKLPVSKIVLCVDSKSALLSIQSNTAKQRMSTISEIQCEAHDLIKKGIYYIILLDTLTLRHNWK